MPTVKLTEKTAQAATAAEGSRVELWDEQTPGLCLRVSSSGRKVWIWRHRAADGRQPRLTLGDFSERYGVRWARDQVEELRLKVRRGEDPQYERRAAAIAARTEPLKTFDDLSAAYFLACEKGRWKPRRKQKRQTTIESERAILKRNVTPILGQLRLEDIGKTEIRRLLEGMLDRGIGAQTNKTHAIVRQVLAFAVSEERILTNPAALIAPPAEVTARKRTLNDVELRLFWEALESDDELWVGDESARRRLYVGPPMRILLKLALLLLVRRGELAGMRVDELDLDHGAWLIPGPRTKSGAPHFVPLSERAVELIREAIELAGTDGKAPICVFPSPRSSEKPIRADSVTHAMTGLCTALGLPSAAPHDLRRTGATLMTSERLRISPFIRSKVLSHRTDAGGGAMVSMLHYDSNEYVAEKRGALEAWANLLMQIVGEIAVDNNVRRLDDSPGFRR